MVEDNNIELETNVETNNIELEGTISEVGPKGEKGDIGLQGPPGISPKVSFEKINKVLKITIEDQEGKHIAYLNDGKDGTGSGDMQKEIYDTDNDGVVDNAQKVNNHIVKSDVPENAKFTDTIYDDTNLKKLISDLNNIKADKNNLDQKVDKIPGKFLSSNDYTDEEKEKLNSLKYIDFDKKNNEVQFKVGEEKVYPNIKRELVSATCTLNQRYNHQHLVAWSPAKINLTNFKTTSSKLQFENNQIKIGKGIAKILVSGQIAFWKGNNPTLDFVQADILLNGISKAFCTIIQNDIYQLSCLLTPILLEVKENDLIGLGASFGSKLQTFGVLENGTYLTVEVIE